VFTPPDFIASPANRTTDSKQQGVELFLEALIGQSWRVFGSYTYLDADENEITEVRRANHIASLNVGWRDPSDRFGANISIRYNGDQVDTNFGLFERVTLPAFTLINIGADWRIAEAFQLYGRIENALHEEYEEVFSFRSSGRAVYAGVRVGM
jgi:vitamin B12 transporter